MHVWKLTTDEWNKLNSAERANFTDAALGASPYHSNYHYLACLSAYQRGEDVPAHVINSFDEWTQKHAFEQ